MPLRLIRDKRRESTCHDTDATPAVQGCRSSSFDKWAIISYNNGALSAQVAELADALG